MTPFMILYLSLLVSLTSNLYLEFPEYKSVAMNALEVLVMMLTTYLSEQGFSTLVELKSKKRNSLLDVDSVMRCALEKEIEPGFEKLVAGMQEHPSH